MAVPSESDLAPGAAGWVTIARVAKAQGLRGELAADLLTDQPERFDRLRQLWLLRPDGRRAQFALAGYRWHQARVLLMLDGIADRDAAAAWAGAEVQVPRTERAAAPPGRYYLDELVGCALHDRGEPVGTVTEVELLAGAAALLHVATPRGEALIPFAAAYLDAVDTARRVIAMRLPDGLLDVNLRPAP